MAPEGAGISAALPHLIDFPLLCAHQKQVVDLSVEVKGSAAAFGRRGNHFRPVLEGREAPSILLYPVGPPLGQPESGSYEGRSQPSKQKLGPWAAARAWQLGLCTRARASADRNGAWINKVGIELNRVGVRVNRDGVCKQGYGLCKQGYGLHKQGRN